MSKSKKLKLKLVAIFILAATSGLISYPAAVKAVPPLYDKLNQLKFNLGLDLQGGIHLEYKADVSGIDPAKIPDAMQGAQDVIERRVNAFGVGEPLVQPARSGNEYRIVVELPGIKDIEQAKQKIKDAPLLEFKEEGAPDPQIVQMFDQLNAGAKEKAQKILEEAKKGGDFTQLAKDNSEDPGSKDKGGDLGFVKKGTFVPEFDKVLFEGNLKPGEVYPDLVESQFGWHVIKFIESRGEGDNKEVHAAHILFAKKDIKQYPQFSYQNTGLTGKNLKSATAQYSQGQGLGEPEVALQFDEEGTKLFAELTKKNIGKKIAIFLDGEMQIEPTVNTEITNGQAVITGNYTIKEARDIAQRLNQGALPVPLTLVGQQSVEASLGQASLQKSLFAGMIGLGAVILFMLFFYRFLGLVASLALLIYTAIMLALFKVFGFTMTLSGIAGFVLSIGMAVDANILIFERTKEEIRNGRSITGALDEGFKRAWTSIRDGNMSSIITSVILVIIGTGFVKGFAVTLLLGVVVSMFTAVVVSRTLLKALVGEWMYQHSWLIGVNKKDISQQ